MGPFKTAVLSGRDCPDPSKPYIKNPSMVFYPTVHNVSGRTVIHGNFTVFRDTKDVKIKIRSYFWKFNKWVSSPILKQVDCHGSLLQITFSATNVKYDKKQCMFFKGAYAFKNLEFNYLQHIWASKLPYGRILWRLEVYSKDGMYFCNDFDSLTVPG
uniref:Uncharacterized protein n=1 Tax=Heliothis virescens TaxID=7102 RepID=A0A2A4J5L4_HELVI